MDVFVDLDDTLFCGSRGKAEESRYTLVHGAKEFIQALYKLPKARISFFSGGPASRNEPLVNQMLSSIDPDGRLPYKVFSKENMTMSKKKRLRGLFKDIDLEQAILIDDTAYYYAEEGEERNFLHVYSGYMIQKHHCGGLVMRARQENKLIRALGMVIAAIDLSRCRGCSIVEALTTMQWYGGTYRHDETNAEWIYMIGLNAMRDFNPDLDFMHEREFGVLPWTGGIMQLLGHAPDSDFARNFFSAQQINRILSSISETDLLPPQRGVPDEKKMLTIQVVGLGNSKKRKHVELPAGTPSCVVVDTLNYLYMIKLGTLADSNGDVLQYSQDGCLLPADYVYTVLTEARR